MLVILGASFYWMASFMANSTNISFYDYIYNSYDEIITNDIYMFRIYHLKWKNLIDS